MLSESAMHCTSFVTNSDETLVRMSSPPHKLVLDPATRVCVDAVTALVAHGAELGRVTLNTTWAAEAVPCALAVASLCRMITELGVQTEVHCIVVTSYSDS